MIYLNLARLPCKFGVICQTVAHEYESERERVDNYI